MPWNDPRLLNGDSSVDAKASPFVLAISNAGIKVLPSIFNVIIMVAVLSVGNSSIYVCKSDITVVHDVHYSVILLNACNSTY